MQRLRVRYAKRGRLRFTSHRDFSRAFERALVRARIPMAYSSGFNPHPRISYAGASPTGAASEAEYLEIGLAERVEPDRLAADLDEALPDGLDVLEVVEATPGQPGRPARGQPLADRPARRARREVEPAVAAFLARPAVDVERMTKKGLAVLRLPGRGGGLARDAVRRRGPAAGRRAAAHRARGPTRRRPFRPAQVGGLDAPGTPLLTRLAQGPLDAESGHDRRPVIRLTVPGSGPACAILDVVDGRLAASEDPTTFSPARSVARHSGAGRHRTATRPAGR